MRITLLSFSLFIFVFASGFRPFSPTTNVCKTCKLKGFDRLTLVKGEKLLCHVLAQNTDYYVIERFGEVRMIKKIKVRSLEWMNHAPRTLKTGDQVLLHNGVAYHGTIVSEDKGRYLSISTGKHIHVIWNSMIAELYRSGTQVKLVK